MKKLLYSICICLLCICQSCTYKKNSTTPPKFSPVLIDKNFISTRLNDKAMVCATLSEKDLNRKNFIAWLTKNTIRVNQKKSSIIVGSCRKYPDAWFYTEIINTDTLSHRLIVDEFNHIRCDALEVITNSNGITQNWGRIKRSTPLSERHLPFLTYAIPITINSKDTLHVLIHTNRYYGTHEVNIGISTYQNYIEETSYHFLSKIFQVVAVAICAFVMLALGLILHYKTMSYLGIYLISFIFLYLNSWGFIDTAIQFSSIGLSSNNIGSLGLFISDLMVHPFLIELMKPIKKNEKIFKFFTYLQMGVILFIIACHFLPIDIFNKIDTLFYLPQMVWVITIVVLIWIFYVAIMVIIKNRVYYIFIGFSIAFLPFLLQQLAYILKISPFILLEVNHSSLILAAFGLSYMSIHLLRQQLVSRKKHEANLTHVRESMNEIRRKEIESIGRNLHDEVGNTLASALNYLNMKEFKTHKVKNLILNAINEIRMISHNLVKDDYRLLSEKITTLTEHLNDFADTNFVFNDFSNKKMDVLSITTQQNLYGVIQELLTNIIKHSQANKAKIQFFYTDGILKVMVEDDGIGFDVGQENVGIGLKNIRTRINLMKGQLIMDSTPQGSTTIITLTL
jgi:signal transduction histidine kinase